ncbi:hypothetical protein Moror_5276 [Moniliophthora roreri MCA 2997]|uniref:Fe2OG dioxygenase domain-containing protein n=2 Tax=Moniliophthora roreri TaxID=221103 RepID=V2WQH4_MONRO|nr:hypothetical protein Moror_5276 [Moniliophthora roreri MCA 2997]
MPRTNPSREPHPAIDRIRSAVQEFSFTSGAVKVPVEFCDLYYKPNATDSNAESLNLASATAEQLTKLISVCDAAPFGRGAQTVMDESYRKALKLELAQFATPFDLAATGILHKIQQDLVDTDTAIRRPIRAEPYKLNIYDKGAFFKAHHDTPRAENMFGSLVLVFPTTHEGGNLILTEKGQRWTFDAPSLLSGSTPTSPEVAFVAFFSDTMHEVQPVTSGARITLTYNLYFDNIVNNVGTVTSVASAAKLSAVKEALKELLADPSIFKEPYENTVLCFGLAHQYPVNRYNEPDTAYKVSELSKYLKGSDALLYHVCKDLGLDTSLRIFYKESGYYEDHSYLAKGFLDDIDGEVEGGLQELCQGMEPVYGQDGDGTPLLWVTKRSRLTGMSSHYIAYGNEASLASVYGEVCIIARPV